MNNNEEVGTTNPNLWPMPLKSKNAKSRRWQNQQAPRVGWDKSRLAKIPCEKKVLAVSVEAPPAKGSGKQDKKGKRKKKKTYDPVGALSPKRTNFYKAQLEQDSTDLSRSSTDSFYSQDRMRSQSHVWVDNYEEEMQMFRSISLQLQARLQEARVVLPKCEETRPNSPSPLLTAIACSCFDSMCDLFGRYQPLMQMIREGKEFALPRPLPFLYPHFAWFTIIAMNSLIRSHIYHGV
jgi:hypothetical protein